MNLLPESIRTTSTTALDETWATRLELLRYKHLLIDLENETDQVKLAMWLEMFGIKLSDIPDNLTTQEYRRLLRYIILIFRLSGTKRSIELICYVLGATEVTIIQEYATHYNGKIKYDGTHRYDGGELQRPFVVSLLVTGVAAGEIDNFEGKIRQLFEIFQPVWICLDKIAYAGDGFPMIFPFILAGAPEFPLTFPIVLGGASRFPMEFPIVLN